MHGDMEEEKGSMSCWGHTPHGIVPSLVLSNSV